MELTFNKVNDTWVAEFEAAGDFNLHVEKQKGRLYLYQSTVQGGGFDIVESFKPAAEDEVLDFDFTALIYPKYMKVVSFAPVSVGVVTEA